jgi:T5SS/PEP-CTERM-associated repeat protein
LPIAAAIAAFFSTSSAFAQQVTYSGDVTPNPDTTPVSSWTSSTFPYIGTTSNGTLTIGGGLVTPNIGQLFLGNNAGVTGTLNLTDTGTVWNEYNAVTVGNGGTGVINVMNGATYSGGGVLVLGQGATSSGSIFISGPGSTLTQSGNLRIGGNAVSGTGLVSITNGGTLNEGAYNIAVGEGASSTGALLIDGAGSSMTIQSALLVGGAGSANGTVLLTNGAALNTKAGTLAGAIIGYATNATAQVTVNGSGTKWTDAGTFDVGYTGTNKVGSLSVTNGGAVSGTVLNVYSGSLLTVDTDSSFSVNSGTGALTNNGTIRLVAGAGATAGTYTPITAGSWAGTGTVQALGGEWNATNHTDTVVAASTTAAGVSDTIDASLTQRILVTSLSDGAEVGAGFLGASTSTSITFGATEIGGAELSALQSNFTGTEAAQSVLSGWDFTSSGFSSGSPVYLSFNVGSGFNYNQFQVWQFNGTTWGLYTPTDLAYSNGFVSFTANNLDSYAVTSAVPVPGAAWLFGSVVAGFGLLGRRKAVVAG